MQQLKVVKQEGFENSLEIEFTDNTALLEKYYKLRGEVFTSYWGLENFSYKPDRFDDIAHTLVVKAGEQCLGGARLIIKKAGSSLLLPMEDKTFRLNKVLPHLNLSGSSYAELSRLALAQELRTGQFSAEIYKTIVNYARKRKLKYIFTVSHISQARKAKMLCSKIGINVEINKHVIVPSRPTYEGIRMWLCTTHVN